MLESKSSALPLGDIPIFSTLILYHTLCAYVNTFCNFHCQIYFDNFYIEQIGYRNRGSRKLIYNYFFAAAFLIMKTAIANIASADAHMITALSTPPSVAQRPAIT